MGEAKNRKGNDPNYGKIPKESKRGLVISPPITVQGTSLHAKRSNIDPLELRFGLLFWDRLVWPSSRAIHFSSGPDEQFLEQIGVLSRPEYTFWGDGATGIVQSQIQAFVDLQRKEPGVWALAQGESSLLLRDRHNFLENHGVMVELHKAIPIPTQDVPLAEILEFKERRKDELLSLRVHLESLGQELKKSENLTDDMQKAISKIDSACSDLLSVGKEWRWPVHISNLKSSFTISVKVLPYIWGGWYFGKQFGLSAAAVSAGIVGIAGVIEIKGDFGFCSPRLPSNPFRYAYLAHKELL